MSRKRGMTASPGEIKWQCPYCDETHPTLREIQSHITESASGDHEGVGGESPGEDIVAVDPKSGEEVDRYESTDVVHPSDVPFQNISKRKQIVYAWLANGREEDSDAIATVTGAHRDYVVQVLGQIRRDAITRDYWADDLDHQLLSVLENQLDGYELEAADSETMSTQQQPEDDQVSEDEQASEEVEEVSAKTIVINTYDLTGEDINRKAAWKALTDANLLDVGYEYFRRTFKACIDEEISDQEMEEATNKQVTSVIEPVLVQHGVLGAEEIEREEPEHVDQTGTGVDTASDTREGAISVEEVRHVRDQIELLHEESEALLEVEKSVGSRRAEFISSKTIELLDELLKE